MHITLDCARCFCQFTTNDADGHDPMLIDEPWSSLGDGTTFEDMIYARLTEGGAVCCPQCGAPVVFSEERLGKMAMEMLTTL
jgi:hypothetical protein